jgi:hypothetical protein
VCDCIDVLPQFLAETPQLEQRKRRWLFEGLWPAPGLDDTERLKREERTLRERITVFRAQDRLSREDLHRRSP